MQRNNMKTFNIETHYYAKEPQNIVIYCTGR